MDQIGRGQIRYIALAWLEWLFAISFYGHRRFYLSSSYFSFLYFKPRSLLLER